MPREARKVDAKSLFWSKVSSSCPNLDGFSKFLTLFIWCHKASWIPLKVELCRSVLLTNCLNQPRKIHPLCKPNQYVFAYKQHSKDWFTLAFLSYINVNGCATKPWTSLWTKTSPSYLNKKSRSPRVVGLRSIPDCTDLTKICKFD